MMHKQHIVAAWYLLIGLALVGCESDDERGDRVAAIAAESFIQGFIDTDLMSVLNVIDIPFCTNDCRKLITDRTALEKRFNEYMIRNANKQSKLNSNNLTTPPFKIQRIGTIDILESLIRRSPSSAQLNNLRTVLGGFNSEVHRVAGFRAVLRSAF